MKLLISFMVTLLVTLGAAAQSGAYQLGDKVANFTLKDASNRSFSLSDFAKSKTVVLVFTNSQCPYATQYENRLVTLSTSYASQGVQFIFINPGTGAETLKELASKNYNFPYLADDSQKVTSQFGATRMPEAFVLNNNNGEFTLKYKGAIDDNPQAESAVKNNYLKSVIDEVLANKTVTILDKRATGCMIKKL
ncbi:thioredoxin family protein [Pontibacter sp. SGAir0037]|uniref:thioredoxin family protein n=1 Tax=Pontibacter sp. SGAir0037 TaxID=2571030 RepID=UPI0010CCC69E|nr:thioredoxin family protein [Pontibacter sp. SGAir0037]QCR24582.1 thioredoxin family protein [Pontibacter sp. SGAir0037]